MPLLSAPLPRMAGRLTFMRSCQRSVSELKSGDLAVLGLPFEDVSAPQAGQSLAPRAIRETSVYFGWHANPQFSHPVDIDERKLIQTAGLYERLSDLGDLSADGGSDPEELLQHVVETVAAKDACLILLGGTQTMVQKAYDALGESCLVQMGGKKTNNEAYHIAPQVNSTGSRHIFCCGERDPSEIQAEIAEWRKDDTPIFLHFDLSVFNSSLAVLSDSPRLGGCDLPAIATLMSEIGRLPVAVVHVTGLNPTRFGMGVVKVGQRLIVTALLPFIYSRLGFS